MASETPTDPLNWEEKYRASSEELTRLKNVAAKAVAEHEQLYDNYKENKNQYHEVCQLLKERDEDIQKLSNLIEPLIQDYKDLEVKADVQGALREAAIKMAQQAHKKYDKMKRQSMALVQMCRLKAVDIDFDEPEDEDVDDQDIPNVENLKEENKNLEEKLIELSKELEKVKDERDTAMATSREQEQECKELRSRKTEITETLVTYEQMTDNLQRVSSMALEEISDLQSKCEEEKKLREQAQHIALGFQKEKKVLLRQTQAIGEAFTNESLRKALLDIESLTKELEDVKESYEEQISELTSQLSETSEQDKIKQLERQHELYELEIQQLQKEIATYKKNMEQLDMDKRILSEKLDTALQRNTAPPPPPPPPPPPINILKPIRVLFGGKSKAAKAAGGAGGPGGAKPDPKVENFDKALEELMDRIKKRGKEGPSPHLDALIGGQKKRNSRVDQITSVLDNLGKKRKRFEPKKQEETGPETSNQLMQILARRKESLQERDPPKLEDDKMAAPLAE